HINGKARVAVDVPGTADVVLAVEDDDVVIAQPVELDRRADAAETRPHNGRVELLVGHRHKASYFVVSPVFFVVSPVFSVVSPVFPFEILELLRSVTDFSAPVNPPLGLECRGPDCALCAPFVALVEALVASGSSPGPLGVSSPLLA